MCKRKLLVPVSYNFNPELLLEDQYPDNAMKIELESLYFIFLMHRMYLQLKGQSSGSSQVSAAIIYPVHCTAAIILPHPLYSSHHLSHQLFIHQFSKWMVIEWELQICKYSSFEISNLAYKLASATLRTCGVHVTKGEKGTLVHRKVMAKKVEN